MNESVFIIPARMGSKGFPLKNRSLFQYTADSLSSIDSGKIIVSTDDEQIKKMATDLGFCVQHRSQKNSDDFASLKSVVLEVSEDFDLSNKTVHLLYLTYPQRTFEDIQKARKFFDQTNANSLLCKKEAKTHPYLCFENLENNKARPIINHQLFRRQDYPSCFEVSHFISIFKSEELPFLKDQLYNDETVFFEIEDKIDVDYKQDFLKL
jgi:CMP-N-acetylneuraminic acid synthetase